jgi:hypothetical protein
LDDYLKPYGNAAVKIDVEGAEWEVLQGMQTWLQKHVQVIQVEAFPPHTSKVLTHLNSLGFTLVSQTESDYLLVKKK